MPPRSPNPKRPYRDRRAKIPTPAMVKIATNKRLFMQGLKQCRTCKVTRPLEAFHKNSGKWDGRTDQCRICLNPGFKTPEQRFWKYVDKSKPATARNYALGLDGCWEWAGSRNNKGYGQLHVRERPQLTSRLAWEFCVGPIGDMDVLHKCDNPACCNPGHLFLGTHLANMRDMIAKGRAFPGGKRNAPRLDLETAIAVRYARALAGVSVPRLAAALGVGTAAIYAILNHRSWRAAA